MADSVTELLEALPDPTARLGDDGRVAFANAAFHALFPHPLGRTLLELTRDGAAARASAEALAGKPGRLEVTIPSAQRALLLILAPLVDGALLTARDVTEAKRMERARRDFVANASHELKTPVTAICGAAETLLDGAVEDRDAAKGFVEMIARHAERLSRLTQELLDLSRIESGEWSLQLEPLALDAIAPAALELFRAAAAEKKLVVISEVPPGLRVRGDRRAIEQVLVNLLDNAVKYTPSGGKVSLRATTDDGRITLAVVDTGPGIDRHHLERLFERFYRADTGRARQAGGTGLGLAIVKHLAHAMGGDVGVESNRSGSRFWVSLPAA